MKAIHIDPFNLKIQEVNIPDDTVAFLDKVRELCQCEWLEPAILNIRGQSGDFKMAVWLDEEGMLKPDSKCFVLHGHARPFCGRAVVLGITATGEEADCPLPVEWFRNVVYRASYEQALAAARTSTAIAAAMWRAKGADVTTFGNGLGNFVILPDDKE
jgi:hypothetical protein